MIGFVKLRILDTDDKCSLRGDTLRHAMEVRPVRLFTAECISVLLVMVTFYMSFFLYYRRTEQWGSFRFT